jgi:hypothetical protein
MQTLRLLQELSIDININIKEIHYLPILRFYSKNIDNLVDYLFNLIEEINNRVMSIGPGLYIDKENLNLETNFNVDLFKILRIKVCREDRQMTTMELNKIVSDLI